MIMSKHEQHPSERRILTTWHPTLLERILIALGHPVEVAAREFPAEVRVP